MRSRIIRLTRFYGAIVALLLLLTACSQNTNAPASTATPTQSALDVYGTPITFPKTAPQRIISLVPNMSEILGALQLERRVVGVDNFTNYPASMATIAKVSNAEGTFNIEQILKLKPDLLLSYGGETKQYDIQLEQLGLNVVDLPLSNLSQTLDEIKLVGRLTFTVDLANQLVQQLQQQIDQVKNAVTGTTTPSVLLEVDDSTPPNLYVFGGGSFGDELAQKANARNVFHDNTTNGGYPEVTAESVISANPQYIILTEDPQYGGDVNSVYQRPNWGNVDAVKTRKVFRINVNIMQRPGPRIVQGLRCLAQIIHPDKFTGPLPDYCSGTI